VRTLCLLGTETLILGEEFGTHRMEGLGVLSCSAYILSREGENSYKLEASQYIGNSRDGSSQNNEKKKALNSALN